MFARGSSLLVGLALAACEREPGFDEAYRAEAQRLEQSALAMEQEIARDLAESGKAAAAAGETAGPLPCCIDGAAR